MHKIRESTLNPAIFKAYDIRGKYPSELNDDAAYKTARAIARHIALPEHSGRTITIVVSADARTSSPALKKALFEGLMDQGVHIIDTGFTTTPMHYYIVNKTNADGGVMITGSHLGKEYNGMKISRTGAIPIGSDSGLADIKNTALRGVFAFAGDDMARQGTITEQDFLEEYLYFLEAHFLDLKDFEISFVADPGNGMTALLLRKLFVRFPKFHVEYLHDELDLTFPNHEANPLKLETLRDVQELVPQKRCALGVSFDGDGDRIGFVDAKGAIVRGDLITPLLAHRFITQGEKAVYDVSSSRSAADGITALGGVALESRVGHAFIKMLMRKEDAIMGGENSGHYYFRDFFYADSALFALLSMLDVMRCTGKSLRALKEALPHYAKSPEINFHVENKDATMDRIAGHFHDGEISYPDGLRVMYWGASIPRDERWWFGLRPSNTENLLRLNIEAATPELLDKQIKLLSELIEQSA